MAQGPSRLTQAVTGNVQNMLPASTLRNGAQALPLGSG